MTDPYINAQNTQTKFKSRKYLRIYREESMSALQHDVKQALGLEMRTCVQPI